MFPASLLLLKQGLSRWLSRKKWHSAQRIKRLCCSWAYFRGSLTAGQAQTIIIECRHPSGWYPIDVLSVETTLEYALELYENHSDLRRLIHAGCMYVYNHWDSSGDLMYDAGQWAIDEAIKYANLEGIKIISLDKTDDGID